MKNWGRPYYFCISYWHWLRGLSMKTLVDPGPQPLRLEMQQEKSSFSAFLLSSSGWVVSDSSWPHGLQHARLPCPLLSPGVCSNSCPLSRRCHLSISSSASPFSFCLRLGGRSHRQNHQPVIPEHCWWGPQPQRWEAGSWGDGATQLSPDLTAPFIKPKEGVGPHHPLFVSV